MTDRMRHGRGPREAGKVIGSKTCVYRGVTDLEEGSWGLVAPPVKHGEVGWRPPLPWWPEEVDQGRLGGVLGGGVPIQGGHGTPWGADGPGGRAPPKQHGHARPS